MSPRITRPLLLTFAFLASVVSLLVVGGFFVRWIVAASFHDAETIRVARITVADATRQQVDEETGVRGYAVAREAPLLEPYNQALQALPRSFQRIRAVVELLGIASATAPLRDARATNRRWLTEIAAPLLRAGKRPSALELRGKQLVDRFRADMAVVDYDLSQAEATADARAERAIFWVGLLAIWAVVAIVVAALVFTGQQFRLAAKIEEQRAEAELQRRASAEIRAAYNAEKRIADTLQGAFAQRVLPRVATVTFSASYMPAAEETRIGGDWYDAVELPDDHVLLAIGDVAGHGIEAAVAMNKARQSLISCALIDSSPGPVLERVNAELVRDASPMITAVAGVVDARTFEFSYAAAGHPPPVLLEPGKRARLLEVGNLPLGVVGDARYVTRRVTSVPGAMLVLYTDGAIEHSRDVLDGEALLLEAVESAARGPEADSAKAIAETIFEKRKIADDVAIVTIRFGERRVA